jgi:hypothetical protein
MPCSACRSECAWCEVYYALMLSLTAAAITTTLVLTVKFATGP